MIEIIHDQDIVVDLESVTIDNQQLTVDDDGNKASHEFSYGEIEATATNERACEPIDGKQMCYTDVTVTVYKTECSIDREMNITFGTTGGIQTHTYSDTKRIFADTCPVSFSGEVAPEGVIGLYNKDPSDASSTELADFYVDSSIFARIGINAYNNDIVLKTINITQLQICDQDETNVIDLVDSTTCTAPCTGVYTYLNKKTDDDDDQVEADIEIPLNALSIESSKDGVLHILKVVFNVEYKDTYGTKTVERRLMKLKLAGMDDSFNTMSTFKILNRKTSLNRLIALEQ